MHEAATQTLRPKKWPSLIPAVAGILLLVFFSNQVGNTIFIASGFLFVMSLVMYLLLLRVSITLSQQGFIHKTAFRTKQVFWSHVSKTFIRYRHHGQSGSYYWYFEDPNENRMKFSVRLFSRSSLRKMAEWVVSKCYSAINDERIPRMAEGKFPWYFI